ncbi:MAG: branched-chain amino acid ABC transporter permease [Desulfobacterales bacterium]|nr:branched-chain amino acid ABC transporter permease [Desulfobacterales bacterium]
MKLSYKNTIIAFAVMLFLPLLIHDNSFLMHILIMSCLFSVLLVGWDLIMGYAGIFSFGQIAIFTIGAYSSAMLSKIVGLPPLISILVGSLIACGVGIIVALPSLRLAGIYVAMVTFLLHEALISMIRIGRVIGTGGATSITGIPPLSFLGYSFPSIERLPWYYVSLTLAFLSYFVFIRIINSSYGISFVALRDAEDLAKSVGVDDYRSKIIVFAMAALFAGLAGGFYAHYMRLVSVRILGLDNFILLLVMLIVGGLGKFPGVIVATFIFTILNEYMRPLEVFRPILLGVMVIVAIIYMPNGIGGIINFITTKFRRFKRIS